MRISEVRTAIDYNRPLHPALRAVHVLGAVARSVLGPLWRHPVGPLVMAAALFFVLLPLDGPISRWLRAINPSGDLRRELEAWQQYGAITSLIAVAAVIALMDPARARRLLDLVAATALTGLAVMVLKFGAARPRPKFDDPHSFVGPFGEYPITLRDGTTGLAHSWDMSTAKVVELWSMCSSHTAYAVVLSVFLGTLYPRLRPLAIGLAVLVGTSRMLFQAHWPTDVLIGAAIGFTVGRAAVRGMWGVRALDWVWVRWIDPQATPMYPRMAALAASGR